MELEAGTVVAERYRITRPLGRGGMGEVFAAENIHTTRRVAIKLLRSDSKSKSTAVARFRREAKAAGSINSDHVTQVLDVQEDPDHGIVLVFELLDGESLIDRLKRTGPIDYDELHPIIEQVWIGLADAHRAGIIHRDLKPSNVFLEQRPDGSTRVKILDFGISKLPKEMGGETLTEMGQSLGTFSFMPPEQIGKAKTVDHRADIYACATLIYQALSGQLPYQARNILTMVELKNKTEARKLSDVMDGPIDPRLEEFLSKALARDPDQRFQSAMEGLAAWRELRPAGLPSGPGAPVSRMSASAPTGTSQSSPHTSSQTPAAGIAHLSRMGAPMPTVGQPSAPLSPRYGPPGTSEVLQQPASRTPAGGVAQMHPPAAPNPLASTGSDLAMTVARPQEREPDAQSSYDAQRTGPYGTALLEQKPGSAPRPIMPYGAQVSSHSLPQVYDEPSTGPPSQEKTWVYRPQGSSSLSHARLVVPIQPISTTPPAPQRSRTLRYLLALLALTLVGFGIGALVLLYLGMWTPS